MNSVTPTVQKARQVLRGAAASPAELLALAKSLQEERAVGLARKVLGLARKDPSLGSNQRLRLKLGQKHCLCTYKDPDLPADMRLARALEILQDTDDLATTTDQETLGLAGAIYKRLWEVDGQRGHLERSLGYYRRGYQAREPATPDGDLGYTGINAAFVLDLLAYQEEEAARSTGTRSPSSEERRKEAREIRGHLRASLPALRESAHESGSEWWLLVTLGEACFGLGDYEEARRWLQGAAGLQGAAEWQRESTARQLAWLARVQGDAEAALAGSEARKVLCEFLGQDEEAVDSVFRGKVGLALSGGGFRASLFHIGVLARLAEMDVLRHVEVLSCVSGGSIVGAHYYLEVRKLLQSNPDQSIGREDYIAIVQRIERDFLAGVQRNLRTRVAAEWTTNLKMMLLPDYSRTQRLGELYEREIFSRVTQGEGDGERWINDLKVQPAGEQPGFSPKDQNWRRKAKVPILILNATTLNTGHNWQFTSSWMGEPPARIDSEIDGNYRLRRMYYEDAPDRHKRVRLGHAVAASSCVPGLFEPIAFSGLYPDRTVRLVDGGVHDNQGAAGLLEQGCTVLLISDASGQMGCEDHPSNGLLGVPLRTNSILQSRLRASQYHELHARRTSSLLQGLMFIHLKKDLDADPVDWIDCQDPFDPADEGRLAGRRGPLTSYGIHKDHQRKLAEMRTDLDSFSEVEAYALMTSGYCMTETALPRCIQGFQSNAPRSPWEFLALEPALQSKGSEELARQLSVASSLAFKIWKLSRTLQIVAVVLLLAVLGVLAWNWESWWEKDLIRVTFGAAVVTGLMALLTQLVGPTIARIVRYRKTLQKIALGLAMCLLGFAAARLHLHVFDKLFLHRGRWRRLPDARPASQLPPISPGAAARQQVP